MAYIDSYMQLNMQTGGNFNFANLNYATSYYGDYGYFQAYYAYSGSDNFYGYGFKYDANGRPTGAGTVTGYIAADYWGNTKLYASGLAIPASSINNAAKTTSVADDLNVIKWALVGNDTILGSDYADVLDGFNGNDTINAWGGNDRVYGSAGNDTLNGMVGNDIIIGGVGADRMTGGLGNDVFYFDNAGDKVVETAGQGTDTVYTSVSVTLAAGQHVETLATTSQVGSGAIKLTGNELAQKINGNNGANVISGGAGNDVINGMSGNDVIYGGTGNDALAGGAGYDHFVFSNAINSANNVDRITDFNSAYDTMRLDNAVMTGLGSHLGTLSSAAFWKSTTGLAHDSNDRVVYETDTGKLFYDSNGSAAGGSVHIATLNPDLALTYADFLVI